VIKAIVSDFGGVLTTPLMQSFLAVQDEIGISVEQFGKAMKRIQDQDGSHPLFEMEVGAITEEQFLAKLSDAIEPELGHKPELHRFREIYFNALDPNQPMIELMRELKARPLRMALLTNNVKEWEPLWRTMLPVDEIFEFVVDSAFVGHRKPDREIYDIVLRELGDGLEPENLLFIDDIEVNTDAARELGWNAVHYREPDQAIAEIRAAVDGG
jgi:epoxide hydrolase-like predicted phosphatase